MIVDWRAGSIGVIHEECAKTLLVMCTTATSITIIITTTKQPLTTTSSPVTPPVGYTTSQPFPSTSITINISAIMCFFIGRYCVQEILLDI